MTAKVLITGTTRGVGLALLQHYDRLGGDIIAVNRRAAPEVESLFPKVRFEQVDVRDREAVGALVNRLEAEGELPETFFLNAGINEIDNDERLDLERYRSVMETNLFGVLHFVEPLTALETSEVQRHVVAISSMASYVGNPYGLGYHTSKRALSAAFDVLSAMYAGTDLVFQQVMLGPVPTGIKTMEAHFPSWVVSTRDAFSGNLVGAVRAITAFAQTDRPKLSYPQRALLLYLAMRLGQAILPGFFRGRITLSGRTRRSNPSASLPADET